MLLKLAIWTLVTIVATEENTHPVCSAVRQQYQDTGCCGEGQASVCVSPTLTGLRNVQPVFEAMEDVDAHNPLRADDASFGGYSAEYPSKSAANETLYLTLIVDALTCIGSFGTSPDPYDTSAILYTFPNLVQVNYATHTQASGPRTDTCTFFTTQDYRHTPDLFYSSPSANDSPMVTALYEQGICSDYNTTTNKFDTLTSYYYYNLTSAEYPIDESKSYFAGFTAMVLNDGWYRESGLPLHRWYE